MASRFNIATGDIPIPEEKAPEPQKKSVVSFGFDSNIGNNNKPAEAPKRFFFRPVSGENWRVALVNDPSGMFSAARVHWVNTASRGRYVICKESVCCQSFGRPRWRIGSVIFRYDQVLEVEHPRGQIMPWIFSERIYSMISQINSHFPVVSHDLNIHCENDRYQQLNITSCQHTYFNTSEAMTALYAEEVRECRQQILGGIGADLSEDELRALIQEPTPEAQTLWGGSVTRQRQRTPQTEEDGEEPPSQQRTLNRYEIAQEQMDSDDSTFFDALRSDNESI